jgi:hypothetical protein
MRKEKVRARLRDLLHIKTQPKVAARRVKLCRANDSFVIHDSDRKPAFSHHTSCPCGSKNNRDEVVDGH